MYVITDPLSRLIFVRKGSRVTECDIPAGYSVLPYLRLSLPFLLMPRSCNIAAGIITFVVEAAGGVGMGHWAEISGLAAYSTSTRYSVIPWMTVTLKSRFRAYFLRLSIFALTPQLLMPRMLVTAVRDAQCSCWYVDMPLSLTNIRLTQGPNQHRKYYICPPLKYLYYNKTICHQAIAICCTNHFDKPFCVMSIVNHFW